MAKPIPKRLSLTGEADTALRRLVGQLGQSLSLDARTIRWPCGCSLWYFRVSFGRPSENHRIEFCNGHRGQRSFFPPPPKIGVTRG